MTGEARIARLLDNLSRRVNRMAEQALCGLGAAMIGVVAAQVFFRYVLNQSLFWSEELARFLLVWLTFIGATVAYRRNAHPRIHLFSGRTGPRAGRAMRIGMHLVALVFCALLAVYGAQFAFFIRQQISPALQLPRWTVMLVLPASGALMMLHAVAAIAAEFGERGR